MYQNFLQKYSTTIWWVTAATVAIILRMTLSPAFIEDVYTRFIFQGIRVLIDNTVGRLPFPAVYLFLTVLLIYLFRNARAGIRREGKFGIKLLRFGRFFLTFSAAFVFLFLFLWGFNYGRVPIERQLRFNPQPLEYDRLKAEFEKTTEMLIAARAAVPGATDSVLTYEIMPEDAEDLIRADLETWLTNHRFPTLGRVRGRLLYPEGILLSISTAGVYLPWVGEGHIDAGMYFIQHPFVMAHEMAHGYGFTDEGTCNFVAYLALKDSENPFFRYSATLGYWVYLASSMARFDYEKYKEFYETLPLGIRKDRQYIRAYSDRFPDIMPQVRDAFYDNYLKTQGVKEGMKSYSRVVMLVTAWEGR